MTSKISRLSISDFQFDGSGGRSRSFVCGVGMRLLSSGMSLPSMTIAIIGILYFLSSPARVEFVHMRPVGIFMTLVR